MKKLFKANETICRILIIASLVGLPRFASFAQAPVISGFSPASGVIGASVTITGNGFNATAANNIVFFGATMATVTAASATSLTVTVPLGATYEYISETNLGVNLTAYSEAPFTVTFADGNLNFAPPVSSATGAEPNSVAIGDIDGDGKPDLVVADFNSSSVSVFLNTSTPGNVSFASQAIFETGLNPAFVSIGDIDGDGRPDLVVANFGDGTISVLRNLSTIGNIFFATQDTFAAGPGPVSIAIGDMDGDGRPDVAVANENADFVSVFLNTSTVGNIGFADQDTFQVELAPSSVAIGDIDGDGKPDLAVTNSNFNFVPADNTVSVLLNTSSIGNISFASQVTFPTGDFPLWVSIGDIDGDGMPDLVVANGGDNTISVLLNQSSIGNASFASQVTVATESFPTSVTIGDIVGDGNADLLVTGSSGNSNVSVLRNNSTPGNVSFVSQDTFASNTNSFQGAIGDIDGDGKTDLVAINANNNTVLVLRQIPLVPPVITSFSPANGAIGSSVTITGTGFNTTAANNIVFFGATMATVTAASATSLTVTVPASATYQYISETNLGDNLTAYSAEPFEVTFANGDIIFAPQVTSATGNFPWSVSIGDIDGDGKPDLAVVNVEDNTVSVYLNTSTPGNVSFAPLVNFPTGNDPQAVLIRDIDGDGKPDLVVTNTHDNTVSVLLNTSSIGNINFAPQVAFATGNTPVSTAIEDLDGDGKPDLAVANFIDNTVSVLLNESTPGNVSFTTQVIFPTGNVPSFVSIGDIDGDGKPDLVVTNSNDNTVSVFLNACTPGNAAFAAQVTFPTGSNPQAVSLGDIDGNGQLDLAVANNNDNTVSILLNQSTPGNVSFASQVTFQTGSGPQGISIGDIDGDGKPDLAVANENSNTVTVLHNTSTIGNASFSLSANYSTGSHPQVVCIGDIDGDGRPDLTLDNAFSTTLSVLLQTVPQPAPTITSFTPASGAIGSSVTITGTGFSDTAINNIVFFGATMAKVTAASATSLTVTVPPGATYEYISETNLGVNLTAYSAEPFQVTYPNGNIDFAAQDTFATGNGPTSVSIGDIDGDGKPDLVVTNGNDATVSVYLNTSTPGTVSFAPPVTLPVAAPSAVKIGDIDGDGKPDLVLVDRAFSNVVVLLNESTPGNVSFANLVTFNTGSVPDDVSIADIDGDGRPDLVVANTFSSTVSILLNVSTPGNLNFANQVTFATGGFPGTVSIGDIDGDGKPDLAISDGDLLVFLNTSTPGNVSFAPQVTFPTGNNPQSTRMADIDGDGKLDVVVTNLNDNTFSAFLNTSSPGNISFASQLIFATGSSPTSAAFGDIDGDGKPDLAVVNMNDSTVSVFFNTSTIGNISFATQAVFPIGSNQNSPDLIAIGDIDGDGKADLAVVNGNDNTFSVLRQIAPSLIVTSTQTNVGCFGASTGSITVTVSGGTPPYRYELGNGGFQNANSFTSLAAGIYTIIVKDSVGDTTSMTDTITQPAAAVAVTLQGANPSCSGASAGSITSTVTGGTAPYTYIWSNSDTSANIQNLTAGTYSVTVTDSNSCTISGSVRLNNPPCITSVAPVTDSIGGSVVITGSGFNTTAANNIVLFGATMAKVTSASATSLTVTVPLDATYDFISETNLGVNLTAYSDQPFDATFPGAFNFAPQDTFATGDFPYYVSVNDIDGDGKSDLVVVNSNDNTVSVLRNTSTAGTVSFAPQVVFAVGNDPFAVTVDDIDGDGKPDLVAVNTVDNTVSVLLNTSTPGNISFAPQDTFAVGNDPLFAGIGDIDGDGKPDVVVANWVDNTISVLRNTSTPGNVSFEPQVVTYESVAQLPEWVGLADIDGDGKLDVVVLNYDDTVAVFLNNSTPGNISFSTQSTFAVGSTPNFAGIVDLDGDGKLDIAVANYGDSTVSALRNTSTIGNVSFAPQVTFATGNEPSSLGIGDINGDGKLDLAVTNGADSTVSVFRNTSTPGNISFATQVTFATHAAPIAAAIGDIDGDGKPDVSFVNIQDNTIGVLRQITPVPLSATFTQTNVKCAGGSTGSITINASGGTTPYQYELNSGGFQSGNTFTGLTAGIYNVIVKDAGDTSTSLTVIITQPSVLSVSITESNPLCNGGLGVMAALASGGTRPYAYSWSNGKTTASDTAVAGNYLLIVTDSNGCNFSDTLTLTNPPKLTLSLDATNPQCNGASTGKVTTTVGGGTGSDTYKWNTSATTDSITGLIAGPYSVTVTDANGCTISSFTTLINPPALGISMVEINPSCNGGLGIMAAFASGGTGTDTYSWNNGKTTANDTTVAGDYQLTVTDANNCKAIDTASLTNPPLLTLSLTTVAVPNAQDTGTITSTVTGGTGTDKYLWSNEATTPNISGVGGGTYSVTVTDANGCTTSASTTLTITVNLSATFTQTNVTCFGASTGSITVNASGGSTPYQYELGSGGFQAGNSFTGLAAGTYIINVKDAGDTSITLIVDITQPSALNASITESNPLCNGGLGVMAALASGGTRPYAYSWSNGKTTASDTAVAGNYLLIVTDSNNCGFSNSASLINPPLLTLSLDATNPQCNGASTGKIITTVGGGTGSDTYKWNTSATTDSITGLIAGPYSVTVTDANGCTISSFTTLINPPALGISMVEINPSCNGGTGIMAAFASGGTGTDTYSWNNGKTTANDTTVAGDYQLTVTDANNCKAIDTASLTNPPLLTLSLTTVAVPNAQDTGTITSTVTGGTGTDKYLWSNEATTPNISGVGGGTYSVTVTDANGCTISSSTTLTIPIQGPPVITSLSSPSGAIGGSLVLTGLNFNDTLADDVVFFGATRATVTAATTTTLTVTVPTGATYDYITETNIGGVNLTAYSDQPFQETFAGDIDFAPQVTFAAGDEETSEINAVDIDGDGKPDLITVNFTGNTISVLRNTSTPGNVSFATQDTFATGPFPEAVAIGDLNGDGKPDLVVTNEQNNTISVLMNTSTPGNISFEAQDIFTTGLGEPFAIAINDIDGDGRPDIVVTDVIGNAVSVLRNITTNADSVNFAAPVSFATGSEPFSLAIGDIDGDGKPDLSVANEKGSSLSVLLNESTPGTISFASQVTISMPDSLSKFVALGDIDGDGKLDLAVAIASNNTIAILRNTSTIGNISFAPQVSFATASTPEWVSVGDIDGDGKPDIAVANGGNATVSVLRNTSTVGNISFAAQDAFATVSEPISLFIVDIDGDGKSDIAAASFDDEDISVLRQIPLPNLNATSTQTNVNCFGAATGSITVTVTGGAPPYQFKIGNGSFQADSIFTGLAAGAYTVVVEDAGDTTFSLTDTITQPAAALTLSLTGVSPKCSGASTGKVTTTVTGGTGTDTYKWNTLATTDSITGVPAGSYAVTVTDANGCTISSSTTLINPSALGVTITPTNPLCNGGAGVMATTVSGGTGTDTYSWSNGKTTPNDTAIADGYSVTVTDANGCTISSSTTLVNPPSLGVTITPTNPLCNGGNGIMAATVSGGTGADKYSWSNGKTTANDTAIADSYSVTVTDANGCTVSSSSSLVNPPALGVTVTPTNPLCNGGHGVMAATISGGTGVDKFSWSNGKTTANDTAVAASYSVTVTDANGCTISSSTSLTNPPALSINLTAVNPGCNGGGTGSINASVSGGTGADTYLWSDSATTPDIDSLSAGTYSVTVTDANGCTDTALQTLTNSSTGPTPSITIGATPGGAICAGTDVVFNANVTNGGTSPSYQWQINGVNVGTNSNTFGSATLTNGNIITCSLTGLCQGNVTSGAITMTVDPPLTLNPIANQTVCAGTSTSAVSFSGVPPLTTFSWTNSNTTIGLAASGSGNISSFTALNESFAGASPEVANISVTTGFGFAYMVNLGSDNVSVINTFTNTVVAIIPVGAKPQGVSVSPDGSHVYVTNTNSNTVSVINTSTNTVTASIPVESEPVGISISPDGSRVYVTDESSNAVSVINTSTNTVTATIPVESEPVGISITPDGSRVYVANFGSNTVSVINIADNVVTANILVGNFPFGVAINPEGNLVYVTNESSGTVSVINTSNDLVVATVPVGSDPVGISMNPEGSLVYVTNEASGTVSVINTSFNDVTATIPVGSQPVGISISPDGSRAYVANFGSNTVSVINTTTNTVTNNITAGIGTEPIAFGNSIAENTCGASTTLFTITVNPKPFFNITPTNPLCNGGLGVMAATINIGTSTDTYVWSNGDTTANDTAIAGAYSVTVTNTYSCTNSSSTTLVNPPALGLTITPTNPLCNGGLGVMAATVSGGTGTDTYVWSNGKTTANDTAIAGGYSVTVTDANGCTISSSATLINPAALGVTITKNNPLCSGSLGILAAVANGGTGVDTYSWSNGKTTANDTAVAGIYQLTITDANRCTITTLDTLTSLNQTVTPSVSISNPGTICAGSLVTFTATPTNGGTAPAYQWKVNGTDVGTNSNTFSSSTLANGNIVTCVMTSSVSCASPTTATSNSVTVTVTAGISPTVTIGATPSGAICAGSNVTFNATITNGGTHPVYQWKINGVDAGTNNATFSSTSLANGNIITCTLTSNATGLCQNTVTSSGIFMTVNPTLTINPVAKQVVCAGSSTSAVSFSGAVPLTTFTWTNSNTAIGLAASGSGNIPSFTTLNTGATPETATLTVTTGWGYTYIANTGSNTVSVINTSTNSVVATIPVGISPQGVAVSPNGEQVYIANAGSNTVSVINPSTNTVTTTIPVGIGPRAMSVNRNGSLVYVADTGSKAVSVINAATDSVTVTIPVGTSPRGLSISPDESRIYVGNFGSNTVSVINTSTNTVVATISVGSEPEGVSVSPDGNKVYVANLGSNTVTVINASTNSVTATIPVGGEPFGLCLSPNGDSLYVANETSDNISVINTATNSVTDSITVGTFPIGVSISPNGSEVYVTNAASDDVSVINTATNTVVSTINVGLDPVSVGNYVSENICGAGSSTTFTITVNPAVSITIGATPSGAICAGTKVVFNANITNGGTSPVYQWRINGANVATNSDTFSSTALTNGDTITCFLTSNASGLCRDTITSTGIPITVNPTLTVNSVANQVLCAGSSSSAISFSGAVPQTTFSWSNSNTAIGLAASGSGNISSFTAVNTGASPETATITVTPGSGYAYIANSGSNTVSVINTSTNTIVATIPVGTEPEGVSVSPNGDQVYIANSGSANVSVINPSTNTVTAAIPVGDGPRAISVNRNGSLVYVANNVSNTVSVINAVTNTVTATIPVGSVPKGLAISADGSHIYVGNYGSNSVSVINTSTNTVIATISVGTEPEGVSISPDGSLVYVANLGSDTVSVIKTSTNTVTATIAVGNGPFGLSLSPDGSSLYAANKNSDNISVINTATNAVTHMITVGTEPIGVSISPDGSEVYVANEGSNNVSVINTSTNVVTATIPVGSSPFSVGNFVSGNICTGASTTFTITVDPVPTITIHASATTICAGTTVTFTATQTNGGASPIYQWQINGEDVGTNSPAFSSTTLTNDDTITCVLTSSNAALCPGLATVTSSGITMTVNPIVTPSVSVSPSATTICTGTDVTFIATPTNGGATPAYQWRINGADVGTNSATFSSATLANGSVITCVMTSDAVCLSQATGTSAGITMTVNPIVTPSVTISASATTICAGTSVTFTATPTNGGATPAYQWKINGTDVGTNSAGLTTFTSSTLTNGNVITCAMTSAAACITEATATSAGTTMTVNPLVTPTVSISASATTICAGTAVTFTATATNGGTAPVYQWIKDFVFVGTNSPTFENAALNNQDSVWVELTSNATCPSPDSLASTAIVMTVNPTPTVNTVANEVVCPGVSTSPITFSGAAPQTTFSWANSNTTIGLAASGHDSIPSFTPVNAGATTQTATITVTPGLGFAYIANSASNNVSVINTSTGLIETTIPVGTGPEGVSVSPNGSRVYVTNNGSNNVSVINTSTNTVIATVGVGKNPIGVTVSPNGDQVYVANESAGTVSVITTSSNTVTATITVGSEVLGVAVNPGGNLLYVTGENTAKTSLIVAVYNIPANTLASTITVTTALSSGTVISPNGSHLYVSDGGSNEVSVYNIPANTVAATIPVEKGPISLCISPDGSKVYVANDSSSTVSVINTSTNTVTATIAVGSFPFGVSLSSDGSTLYVVNEISNNVMVINTATNEVVDTIAVGSDPTSPGNFVSGSICPGTPATFTITVDPKTVANPSAITGPATVCANSTQTYSVTEVAGLTYTWTVPAGVTITAGQGTESITVEWGTVAGTVSVETENACASSGSVTKAVTITTIGCGGGRSLSSGDSASATTGIAQTGADDSKLQVNVYPNPSHDNVTVEFNATVETGYHLEIYDILGSLVLTTEGTTSTGWNKVLFDVSTIAQGLYIVHISNDANADYPVVRFVKDE